jgi:hypothetical protein
MPSARTEVAVAQVCGKIMWSAGSEASASWRSTIPRSSASAAASQFRALRDAGAVGLNGKLYIIGGYVNGLYHWRLR